MAEYMKEQEKPLATETDQIGIEESNPSPVEHTSRPNWKCIICCGCCAAIFLIIGMIVLILMFTVFRIKEPILKMNSMKVQGLNLLGNTSLPPIMNLTLKADISVENPNYASFKFSNATTSVYYDNYVIGEFVSPAGRVQAKKSVRTSVTIDILVDKISEVPRFRSDFGAGILPVSTFIGIRGKVKVTDVFKKRIFVQMNCTMNWNLSSQAIQNRNCKTRVKF
ncbi:late embryogenesis abundant protein At1g64065-like [Primulina huaijiensis]|uniref:late embryogenesis abundant protein At1g64065-like n=1 Tax=Primulina huaijiensis TaxID=1492673 RepID=UPI003CC79601